MPSWSVRGVILRTWTDGHKRACRDGSRERSVMARSKRKRDDLKDLYRRIRKPMPPPAKVERDRRRKIAEEQARREAENETTERKR